ncbi:hypothetical protein PR003_g27757 [Phytophthora rubi]|uniref:Uncharacterized protein n=1 Tax=Phytophthora rubi TaxID=129364 RepID=A0A6A4BVX0_9STRA|nr:hypothetical protein PR002_g26755 [Phytophthora rubi]KAE8972669.1 hypothetical protein PR001_g26536 [Phytophthora rubi]KAE9281147.1 hypothetical protein PR003_g27757 [Phytophthora rubi]
MVSTSIILSAGAALAVAVQHADAHGYMYIPLAEFDGTATSSWIVQISPQWSGDWDSCSSDDSDCLTSVYTALKSSNGYSDIRTLLDSDASLYGADCGYTDPDATAKDPPTTGDATFSRGMVHVGPCEIWLDDTMVLSNDDCLTAYGDGTVDTKSVFTPVDYSSCSTSGCMLRFYWLAFQGVDSEIVWQVYKDCVPLTGPVSGSSTSTTTTSSATSDAATSSTTENEADTTTSTTSGDSTTAASLATTSESTTASSAITGGTTTGSSTTTAGNSSTSTGSTAAATSNGNSWTSGSSTHGNGKQGGNGWSGGFGGMGGGLRK